MSKTLNHPQITIVNDYLQAIQQRHAFAITLLPLLGVVLAVVQVWNYGISAVDIAVLLIMYGLTVIGVEVGLHRYFSHKSFDTHPPIRWVLGVLGSMAAQGPLIYWAANHRRHHQFSDRTGDPHSPYEYGVPTQQRLKGLWHAHTGWMFHHTTPNPAFFTKEMCQDTLINQIDRLYLGWVALGLGLPSVIVGLFTQSWAGLWLGFLWGGLVRIFIVNQGATFFVNSVCHTWGKRPFNTQDSSTNNIWLVLVTFGGAWHNNHHAFPNAAMNDLEWWQLDLSGCLIRVLKWIGWAWNVKQPTKAMIEARKHQSLASP